MELLEAIIEILVGGLTKMAQGIGSGLNTFVNSILTPDGTTLTVFGSVVAIFAGIGLAVSIGRLVLGWIMSLGGRNRA